MVKNLQRKKLNKKLFESSFEVEKQHLYNRIAFLQQQQKNYAVLKFVFLKYKYF